MHKISRATIVSTSIIWFAVTQVQQAHAQSCASRILSELASGAGLPTTVIGLIPFALKHESTAEPLDDEVVQTSPRYLTRDGNSLRREDSDLEKAQQFLRSTYPTESSRQNCISSLQKVRDNIQKELSERDLANVPDNLSMKQFLSLRDQRSYQATHQHYDRNPMPPGGPGGHQPYTSPGNSGDNGGGGYGAGSGGYGGGGGPGYSGGNGSPCGTPNCVTTGGW